MWEEPLAITAENTQWRKTSLFCMWCRESRISRRQILELIKHAIGKTEFEMCSNSHVR